MKLNRLLLYSIYDNDIYILFFLHFHITCYYQIKEKNIYSNTFCTITLTQKKVVEIIICEYQSSLRLLYLLFLSI